MRIIKTNPATYPPELREHFEERAAIMEYDGDMPRWRADELAMQDSVIWWREKLKEETRG